MRDAGRRGPRLALAVAVAMTLTACAGAALAGAPDKEDRMLERALALLEERDPASICEGARALGALGRKEAIAPLLGHLRTRDEAARECVRAALARLDVVPVLLADWRGADRELQDEALERAVALPHPGLLAILADAARSPEARRRKRAATGLRRQTETSEVVRLLEALVADPDRDVRWWAIDTLGLSTSAESTRLLRSRLETEPEADLRTFIARHLDER